MKYMLRTQGSPMNFPEGDGFLDHIITSNETWCHHNEMESEQKFM